MKIKINITIKIKHNHLTKTKMTKTVRDKQTNHIQTHKYKPDNSLVKY